MSETCRPLLDDHGNVVARVRGEQPLSPEAEAAMRDLVAAVQHDMDTRPDRDEWEARAVESQRRIAERNARLRSRA